MMGQCVVGVCRRVALQNMEDAFGGLARERLHIFGCMLIAKSVAAVLLDVEIMH